VQRRTIETSRGAFAALEAFPNTGLCERRPALLDPGYTGSKEDFLLILQALAAAGIPYLVLRTSWVYGAHGKNFLLTILKLAQQKPELRIVADQTGAPTWSRDIAQATAAIAAKWLPVAANSGVYHLTASGSTTWHGFATQALRLLSQAHPADAARLARPVPISTAEYPTAATRPKNSQLDCARLARVFHTALPEWQTSLASVMEEYELALPAAVHNG
jgi:dTDP-4-dehydrorhamnose reductase